MHENEPKGESGFCRGGGGGGALQVCICVFSCRGKQRRPVEISEAPPAPLSLV